jgi:predicted lipid-binding transport protein (Tim44 family)
MSNLSRRLEWYEYLGADVIGLNAGIVIGSIATHFIGVRTTTILGVIGFVLACVSVWLMATGYRVKREQRRAEQARVALRKANVSSAPMTQQQDVPPEHRRRR